jgi:hypothetical protein
VLPDKLDTAFQILPNMLASEAITPENLRDWPLFRDLRGDPRYEEFASTEGENGGDGADDDDAESSGEEADAKE